MTRKNDIGTSLSAVSADLRWAISSPFLCGKPPPLFRDWATTTDWNAPIAGLAQLTRGAPIGRYFERLMEAWLRSRPGVEALHSNLPVQGRSRTLGELDMVFRAGSQNFHWEMAVKFYLGVGDRRMAGNWYGPEARDRLDLKIDKLATRQLLLPETEAGREVLRQAGFESVDSHELLKGFLFHPHASWLRGDLTCPPGLNPHHCAGWWLPRGQLHALAGDGVEDWMILTKEDWLAPDIAPLKVFPAGNLAGRLDHHFTADHRPLMLAALRPTPNGAREVAHRGFVVPDSWPLLD